MKFVAVLALSFILTIAENYTSAASEILYVLPDSSTSAVSCSSQPCATLSQYVLDNGTLPVVSNVEYHFSPGEHHVPANMVLQNLQNFSIIGTAAASNSSSSVVLFGCLQPYVLNIIDSEYVSIKNVRKQTAINKLKTILLLFLQNSRYYIHRIWINKL